MSQFASIKQGLTEAIEHAAGQESEAVVHFPRTLDVKSIDGFAGVGESALNDQSISRLVPYNEPVWQGSGQNSHPRRHH